MNLDADAEYVLRPRGRPIKVGIRVKLHILVQPRVNARLDECLVPLGLGARTGHWQIMNCNLTASLGTTLGKNTDHPLVTR